MDPPDFSKCLMSKMPCLSITSSKTIEMCRNFPLHDSDIFICSYPKSGTTWMQHLILTLIFVEKKLDKKTKNLSAPSEEIPLLVSSRKSMPIQNTPPMYSHVSDYAPFFEIDMHWVPDSGMNVPWIRKNHHHIRRRIYNTHLRFDMLPSMNVSSDCEHCCKGSKFIYVVRSPLDTCVSFFSHLSNQVEGGYERCIEEFCTDWMNGKVAYGTWDDHLMSYVVAFSQGKTRKVKLKDGREFLLILYEEMVKDLGNVVRMLVNFLELENIDESVQNDLLPQFSFDYMRNYINHFQPKSVTWKNKFLFLRNGKMGDGQRMVSTTQAREYSKCLNKRKVLDRLYNLLEENQSNHDVYHLIAPFIVSIMEN